MQKINLTKIPHTISVGDQCMDITPNVTEDSLFYSEGDLIGFYIKDIGKYSEKAASFADIANAELLTDRVPKSTMKRSSGLKNNDHEVLQYSTIIGGVPPKPNMRRSYPTMSSVHNVESARQFVKAMTLLCRESEDIIGQIAPAIFENQVKIFAETVPKKWRFGRMFTSSISNFNIAAAYHRDAANIVGCVNVIIAKKHAASGGNTTVPDYGATVDSADNSMLVYPAWRNLHAVTPIHLHTPKGYRNSLVFYPLKAFATLHNA